MKLNFMINDYILIWNLLFQASVSESLYKVKQKLWLNYKNEYNDTYKEKVTMLKDPKNFIPSNDLIYNFMLSNKEYEKIKKQAEKYRLEIMSIWDKKKREINKLLDSIIRKDLDEVNVYVVNKETNVIDTTGFTNKNKSLIIGKEISNDTNEIILKLLMNILDKEIKNYTIDTEIYKKAILELVVLNEIPSILNKRSCYLTGTPSLSSLKRSIYPYWLMYLGVSQDEFLNRMMRDNIAFETNKYPYDKELKKKNIEEFIDYCIKKNNSKKIELL